MKVQDSDGQGGFILELTLVAPVFVPSLSVPACPGLFDGKCKTTSGDVSL